MDEASIAGVAKGAAEIAAYAATGNVHALRMVILALARQGAVDLEQLIKDLESPDLASGEPPRDEELSFAPFRLLLRHLREDLAEKKRVSP